MLILIVAVVVILVVKPFDKNDKEAVKLEENQIKIGDDVYTFSANGIDNFDKVESNDGECKDIDNFNVKDIDLAYVNYSLYDVQTTDGATEKSGESKLEEAGWRYRGAFVPGGTYFQYYTEEGVIDWTAIEEDYSKVMADNSFKNLDYYDALCDICEYTADECIEADDVAGLEEYGTNSYADSKQYIMSILAHGKLCDQLADGEIDYFVLAFDFSLGQPSALKVYVYGLVE